MSLAVCVDDLPVEAERLLRDAWEKHQSVLLERGGEPLAVVMPIGRYRECFPGAVAPDTRLDDAGSDPGALDASAIYHLPTEALATYHELVAKKVSEGLTADEEREMERVQRALDRADADSPLAQAAERRSEGRHTRWMSAMAQVVAGLRELRELG